MSYIPVDELKERGGISMAPMIDFLFLMLAMFASLTVSRIVIRDTDIDLVQSKHELSVSADTPRDYKVIHLTVSEDGSYKWVTEIRDHVMHSAQEITDELLRQYQMGLLPHDKLKTQVMLKIDREAHWEPILQLLLAVKEAGFEIRPVYEPISVM
ncbi:MAG: biopolymer transporter ExbD [Verrucomicrobia bacterium]|nr:biopolymer transporter ExbD [Verrucomicrobiota bacterium]MBS0645948.1 biopolymer transporter ExbD [Verrucomicrobiota bacterium]